MQDDGQWTLQSVRHQKYLGFENTPKDGTPLDGLDEPQRWDIEITLWRRTWSLSDRFWVRGTFLVVEFPRYKSDPGPLQLWEARDGKNQVWVLEECELLFSVVWRTRVANLALLDP